jgi:hypothetical protein
MANSQSGNTWYFDTAAEISTLGKSLKVTHILFAAANTNVAVAISDGAVAKLNLRNAVDRSTVFYDLSSNPIIFTTSVNVTAVTNGRVTLTVEVG